MANQHSTGTQMNMPAVITLPVTLSAENRVKQANLSKDDPQRCLAWRVGKSPVTSDGYLGSTSADKACTVRQLRDVVGAPTALSMPAGVIRVSAAPSA